MSDYSEQAQPYLDAIGAAIFADQGLRDWLVADTCGDAWRGAVSLHDRQRALRGQTKQPYFCNYWCGRCDQGKGCDTAPKGERRVETDLMAFLQNDQGEVLALHLEFKHMREALAPRQAAMYRSRAACWASGHYRPRRVMPHDAAMTVILCDPAFHPAAELAHFDRVVSHGEAAARIPGWPG